MSTPEPSTPGSRRRARRLTPEAVRRREFIRSPLGRRGYLKSDVDRFRVQVADEIAYADAEKAELRGELDRLRNYFRDNRIDPAAMQVNGNGRGPAPGPSVQAVNMMSTAQQAADQHISQAESYAREMVGDARKQYEQILLTAQARAEEAAAEAAKALQAAESITGTSVHSEELESKIAYLRTFAEVTQVQMRSILQALGQELERLTVHPAAGTGEIRREIIKIP